MHSAHIPIAIGADWSDWTLWPSVTDVLIKVLMFVQVILCVCVGGGGG